MGCRLRGLTFNLIYMRALRAVKKRVAKEVGLHELHWASARPPIGAAPSACNELSKVAVHEATFVDDEMVTISAITAASLWKKLQAVLSIISEEFERLGLQINWARNKSEIIVVFRGKQAKEHKERLREECGGVFPFDSGAIHHVLMYKHLGSLFSSDGGYFAEARARTASAMLSRWQGIC